MQASDERLWHHRLPKWEAFDRIEMRVVPRYKTSGLSGDEWRQHVEVEFFHKGELVHSCGFRDMQAAIMFLGSEWVKAQEPIPQKVIEIEREKCDQPSCANPPVGRLKLKRRTSDQGDWLDASESSLGLYRQFCAVHIKRGDCSREDCDKNYEPLDGADASASTNVQESPSSVLVLDEAAFLAGCDDRGNHASKDEA